jgi:antitoxin component of RelBE/YafQ-DinJ toxin-antitoxin module
MATKQQQGQRYIRDKAIKGLNATPRQYADLMGKSRSIGNYYEKVADRIKAENIVQANVAQKTEAALNHIENIKARAFETADELGLTIDLSGIDNTIGLKPYQRKQLTDLGYNLNDIIGDKALSATQAEEVYKILRGYAYDLMDDSAKPLEKAAGKELNRAADEVSKRIDDVLDNMGIDFKKEFLDGAGVGGADMNGRYLREISQNGKPLSFSDLRREESDWINISKTAGRPIKEEKVPESVAEAIGQAFKRGGEKARERYYERQA